MSLENYQLWGTLMTKAYESSIILVAIGGEFDGCSRKYTMAATPQHDLVYHDIFLSNAPTAEQGPGAWCRLRAHASGPNSQNNDIQI